MHRRCHFPYLMRLKSQENCGLGIFLMNWLRVFEGRRIWLEAASVLGFRRSAERCAQKNCPIRANPNYDEIALPVPTFGHSGLPAIGLTPNSARQQKSEDWGGLQPNSPAFKNPQPVKR